MQSYTQYDTWCLTIEPDLLRGTVMVCEVSRLLHWRVSVGWRAFRRECSRTQVLETGPPPCRAG